MTATGAFLGTPAFCPPEQLRGEELNACSDIYSVGATLFYLLTGRTPFQAKNIVALIATVLEHPAPSPRQFNPGLPLGLERAVRRCLEKQSQERFKNYSELAKALAPFGSTAPTPAPLGLRFLAGVFDVVVLGGLLLFVLVISGLDPMELLNATSQQSWKWPAIVFFGVSMSVLYYTVLEGRWGAAVGKALFNLRIIGPKKSPPGLGRAFFRALIYVMLPLIPVWLIVGFNPKAYLGKGGILQFIPSLLFYASLAALFLTARKRNGYAALHDMASHSHVITRICLQARPTLSAMEAPPTGIESHPRIGPYYVIQPFDGSEAQPSAQVTGRPSWFIAYDIRLLRKVWIRTLPLGAPPISPALRNLGRIGRLRWLTGRRTPEENWDAFEGVSGQPLLSLVAARQVLGWQQVRFWLLDLAQELTAAEKDQTLPADLALDRIWITAEGRLKLLDFAAPGLPAKAPEPPLTLIEPAACQGLLKQMANVALAGSIAHADHDPALLPVPLPMHARNWLKKLTLGMNPHELASALQPLLAKPAAVTRLRRAGVVGACLLLPIIGIFVAIFGTSLIRQWEHRFPGLFDLTVLLQDRWARQLNTGFIFHFDASGFTKEHSPKSIDKHSGPSDRELAIFISSRYRSLITNSNVWPSALALSLIKGESRRFAEQSLIDYRAPSAQEVERAVKLVEPTLPKSEIPDVRKHPFFLAGVFHILLALYVGIPAVLGAVLFRRGLVLLGAGVVFVRRDGRRASRRRLLLRSLAAWGLVVPTSVITIHAVDSQQLWSGLLLLALLFSLTLVSILLPQRGLPDRFAGTYPVPA